MPSFSARSIHSLRALGAAAVAGLLEWLALWRSRRRTRVWNSNPR